MEIGITPQHEDKPKPIPKFLYYVEFTCYSKKCKEFLVLENSKQILPELFNKTACHTLIVHFCAEFEQVNPDPVTGVFDKLETDIHKITYAMYNEYFTYYSFNTDEQKAKGDCKSKTSIHVEIIDFTRYRLIRQERKLFIQPFKLSKTNYQKYLDTIQKYNSK